MFRALAVAGVMGAGTALVFSAAFLAFALLSSDRLTWQLPGSNDEWMRIAPGPVPERGRLPGFRVLPDGPQPDRPWRVPVFPDPGERPEPPVLIEPAEPRIIDPTIEG